MTRRELVLIRHAKTAEGHPDIERVLTARGHADAAAIGRLLVTHGVTPERAVVSPAARAQQTWAAIQGELPGAVELITDDRIYDNDPDLLLDIARETPAEVGCLVLVGHNPSFGALAHRLAAEVAEFPTGAVAVFTVPGAWAELDTVELSYTGVGRGEA